MSIIETTRSNTRLAKYSAASVCLEEPTSLRTTPHQQHSQALINRRPVASRRQTTHASYSTARGKAAHRKVSRRMGTSQTDQSQTIMFVRSAMPGRRSEVWRKRCRRLIFGIQPVDIGSRRVDPQHCRGTPHQWRSDAVAGLVISPSVLPDRLSRRLRSETGRRHEQMLSPRNRQRFTETSVSWRGRQCFIAACSGDHQHRRSPFRHSTTQPDRQEFSPLNQHARFDQQRRFTALDDA